MSPRGYARACDHRVIARTTAVIEPGGLLGELACAPPLTLRQVRGEDPERCELRLVGTAAGPLPGDDLALCLRLKPGARAVLRATGSHLAQGRSGGGAAMLSVRAEIGDGARLDAEPGPLIVCQGSRVDVRVELALGAGAAAQWRELIVLGRTREPPGQATLRWDVTRVGRPLFRQFVNLADAFAGRTLVAGRRVLASALLAGLSGRPRTVVASPLAVAQLVAEDTVLVTVLADNAASATRQLDELCDRAHDDGTPGE
jgi:urease accessory protein